MRLWKPNVARMAAHGDRRGLVRALAEREAETRWAAAEALVSPALTAAEVEALTPVLGELVAAGAPAPPEAGPPADLALRLVTAFGQARWRHALPALLPLCRERQGPANLQAAAARAVEAIQPGLLDPKVQASDSPLELDPRTIVEKGLLVRGGLAALKDYLGRMPLCGAFALDEIPLTPREEALRAGAEHFADRRLRGQPDFSGTLDETSEKILEGLYEIIANLGKTNQVSERSVIQPYWREGAAGLAEVRTLFGIEFGYVDLIGRSSADWFYYWGTEE
jgi:hypothetical protein